MDRKSNEFEFTGDADALIEWAVSFEDPTLGREFITYVVSKFIEYGALSNGDVIVRYARDGSHHFELRQSENNPVGADCSRACLC